MLVWNHRPSSGLSTTVREETTWLQELRKGLDSSRKGSFDDALAAFQRARVLAPDRAETACALGREQMRRGEYDEACELLTAAWQPEHSLASAGTSLARCLGLHLSRLQEAHQILDQVDQCKGVQSATRIVRGELLLQDGRHEEAALVTQDLLSSKADEAGGKATSASATLLMSRVENERGLCAVKQGAFERAIFAFKRASDLDPCWAAPLSNLGACFEELNRCQRAEKAYRQACAVDPHYARAWHNLGKLYQRKNDPRSLDSLARGYLADPACPELAAHYAHALEMADAPEQAREILHDHALELGDLGEAWAGLALPLAAQGAYRLAQMCVHEAEQRCPDEALRTRLQAILAQSPDWSADPS